MGLGWNIPGNIKLGFYLVKAHFGCIDYFERLKNRCVMGS